MARNSNLRPQRDGAAEVVSVVGVQYLRCAAERDHVDGRLGAQTVQADARRVLDLHHVFLARFGIQAGLIVL